MHDETRTVNVDPVKAERVIGDFCEHHGLTPRYLFTAAELCELLTAMGYAATPATLAEFVRKRYVGDPGETWDRVAAYCLVAALEARRRWLPRSQHDVKKSGIRLHVEDQVAQGFEPVADLDQHSVEDLLLQLVGSDNRAQREVLYEVLRLKLAGYEE